MKIKIRYFKASLCFDRDHPIGNNFRSGHMVGVYNRNYEKKMIQIISMHQYMYETKIYADHILIRTCKSYFFLSYIDKVGGQITTTK